MTLPTGYLGGRDSGSSVLRPPDVTRGFSGGFGADLIDPVTNPNGSPIAWDEGYHLEAGQTYSLTAINNSYMAWNPAGDASIIRVKQAGWYNIGWGVQFDETNVNGAKTVVEAGYRDQYRFTAAGVRDLQDTFTAYLETNDEGTDIGVTLTGILTYAYIFLVPLFTLS